MSLLISSQHSAAQPVGLTGKATDDIPMRCDAMRCALSIVKQPRQVGRAFAQPAVGVTMRHVLWCLDCPT